MSILHSIQNELNVILSKTQKPIMKTCGMRQSKTTIHYKNDVKPNKINKIKNLIFSVNTRDVGFFSPTAIRMEAETTINKGH